MTLRADHGLAAPPAPATTTATSTHGGSDMGAAFRGLIIGSLVLLGLVFTVVKLTARSFEGHKAAPAAGAPATAPAATPH